MSLHGQLGHWLVFNTDLEVTGCHCGFKSDLMWTDGYGDDVVDHLLMVGADNWQRIGDFRQDGS